MLAHIYIIEQFDLLTVYDIIYFYLQIYISKLWQTAFVDGDAWFTLFKCWNYLRV